MLPAVKWDADSPDFPDYSGVQDIMLLVIVQRCGKLAKQTFEVLEASRVLRRKR